MSVFVDEPFERIERAATATAIYDHCGYTAEESAWMDRQRRDELSVRLAASVRGVCVVCGARMRSYPGEPVECFLCVHTEPGSRTHAVRRVA